MTVKEFVAAAGRKFTWGYAALGALFVGLMALRLNGGEFVAAFGALTAAVMAANYGENREKQRALKEVAPDAPAYPVAPPTPPQP